MEPILRSGSSRLNLYTEMFNEVNFCPAVRNTSTKSDNNCFKLYYYYDSKRERVVIIKIIIREPSNSPIHSFSLILK